jgi:dimeric dUTPase (all-alpha-NTP-PPase superfamily)
MRPETHLSNTQIGFMLEAQRELNDAYNGDTWKTDPSFAFRFPAAADAEWAEFLEEVNSEWKWYAREPQFNREKALFEMIDVAHFMLAGFLQAFPDVGEDQITALRRIDDRCDWATLDAEGFYMNMSQRYRAFWTMIEVHRGNYLMCALVIRYLVEFLGIGAEFLGYNRYQVHEAYITKNQRNHERVKKGVMQGVDVKKDEKELSLG